MVFLTPPFQVPDEPAHFLKACHILTGHFFPVKSPTSEVPGVYLPPTVVSTALGTCPGVAYNSHLKVDLSRILFFLTQNVSPEPPVFVELPTIGVYTPVAYLPQSLGIWVGQILGLAPLVWMYLGRICNLAAWIVLTYWALRLIPLYGEVLLLMALSPMSLFLAASLSSDALTNGLAFSFSALVLRMAYDNHEPLRRKNMILITGLSLLLSGCKFIYGALVLLWALVPRWKFRSSKHMAGCLIMLILVGLGPSLIWATYVNKYKHIPRPELRAQVTYQENMQQKIEFIKKDPAAFVGLLLRTVKHFILSWFKTAVGVLGWYDTPLPLPLIALYIISMLVALFFSPAPAVPTTILQRVLAMSIIMAVLGALLIFEYFFWTPMDSKVIVGIQGRYFIPLIIPICVLFQMDYRRYYDIERNAGYFHKAVPFFLIGVHIITAYYLVDRYYDWA